MTIHTGCRWVKALRGHESDTRGVQIGTHIFCVDLNPPLAVLVHEAKHVEQYLRYGFFGFYARNLWWNLRYGYRRNPFEVEARTWTETMLREPRSCWPSLQQVHSPPRRPEPANLTS